MVSMSWYHLVSIYQNYVLYMLYECIISENMLKEKSILIFYKTVIMYNPFRFGLKGK